MPGTGSRRQGSHNPPASSLAITTLRSAPGDGDLPYRAQWERRQTPYLGGGAQPGRDPGTQGVTAGLRVTSYQDPRKGAGSGGASDSPGHRRRGPTEAKAVQACGRGAHKDSDARIPGGEGGRLRAVRDSVAPRLPRGFPTAGGPDAGPGLREPRSRRAGPDPLV
ncbi:uncharacterized protein LOC119064113 [Artibeus jamaicensis]|uniref:uncharacterized protein LOC119064113 n=1 Tax=Artibeus jamaicensis TaxID=9417 RepID=UPI00235AAA58|nr:uncharacterized protein LOC119064113 [Artibeus jamaicensis]